MNANNINTTFDLLSLVEGHTTLKQAGRYWSGPCPFCGGNDRFEVKRSDQGGYVWRCRHCAASKGYYSAIDYGMRYWGLSFKETLEAMGGASDRQTPTLPKREIRPYQIPPLPDSDWQIKMLGAVDRAAHCLQNSPDGQPGRDYLTARGLHLGTWSVYSLGYSSDVNDPMLKKAGLPHIRPAIIIPWLDDEGVITCMNNRFVDFQPGGLEKYKTIGKRSIFGLNAIWHAPALMICEGELNCCSIHQSNAAAGGLGLVAVSIGGEDPSELTLTLLKALVQKFELVFCWIDKPERAQAIVQALNRPAQALKSPIREGLKLDANAMLQRSILPGFLQALLKNVCMQTYVDQPALARAGIKQN